MPQEALQTVAGLEDPGRLADTIAGHLAIKTEEKQALLETLDANRRLETVLTLINRENEILQIESRIKNRVKKQMEKTQREYYLNEQMRAIQKEMGEKEDFKGEIQELERRIRRKKMSAEATAKVKHELKKLKLMSPMSAEATVSRNYIDWLLVPALVRDAPRTSTTWTKAERILDEDHYGLDKPKERILEYLAVQSLVKKMKGPILCLVGPPGVGKTSLAKSVARALGRNFVRLSLGGVRDEAEIRGHRRTYIGALPGKIIQSLQEGQEQQPGLLPGRSGQDEHRLPGRPLRGPPGGPGPGTELRLQRPLPGRGLRPVRGHVHHHGQQPLLHPACPCRTAWRSSACRATPRWRSCTSPSSS